MRALLALLVACHPDPAPASPPPRPLDPVTTDQPETFVCAKYGYYVLYPSVSIGAPTAFDHATEAALHEDTIGKNAAELGDHHEAAVRFMACAKAYRAVPDAEWDGAKANADLCYGNAMWAFANAHAWAKEGKAALERAIDEDPRMADAIRARLADPPRDCDP